MANDITFDELVHLLGARTGDAAWTTFRAAHRMRIDKMDKVKGEPRTSYARLTKREVVVHLEDDVVTGFTLEGASQVELPKGLAWGAARAAVAKALGKPREAGRFHDERRLKLARRDARVRTTFAKGALVQVEVELWRILEEREAREQARIDDTIAAPATGRATKALSAAAKRAAPDVTAMLALVGRPARDAGVVAVKKALRLPGAAGDEVWMGPDVLFGFTDGSLTMISTFADWGGGLEHGLVNGASTRADVRRALGAPAASTEFFDIFQDGAVRRQVSYIGGVVSGWSVDTSAAPPKR